MPAAVLRSRLARQHLARPAALSPQDIVGWFGAVQAQEYGPARWGVGQRGAGLTDAAVASAFERGEILRTHVMRATWHFVAPQDIRWMQMVTAPRVRAASASVLAANAIDARVLARSRDVIVRALEGGAFLTRAELSNALARARIRATGQRLAYLVMDAELEALVCSGPRRGKQFTYALVEHRAPRAEPLVRDDALGELARRYFRSHGPATLRDFTWWSGLTVREARAAADIARIARRAVDGFEYWSTDDDVTPSRARAAVHLLPVYDEFVNAYRDRGLIVAGLDTYDNFAHYFVVDGCVAGTWRPISDGDGVRIESRRALTSLQAAALRRAVARYQAFYRTPA